MIYAALLGTSFVTPSLLSGTAVLIALTEHGERLSPLMEYVSIAVMLFFFVVLPSLAIAIYARVSASILARNPCECWQHTDRDGVEP